VIYSVLKFNLGSLEICLVGAKPPVATELVANKRHLF